MGAQVLELPPRPDLQANLRLSHVTCAHFTRHLFIPALLVFFCRVRIEVQSSADVSSPQGKVVGFQADYFNGCIVTFDATSKDFSGFFKGLRICPLRGQPRRGSDMAKWRSTLKNKTDKCKSFSPILRFHSGPSEKT